MDLSVVVRAREDGANLDKTLGVVSMADRLGYGELWIGEGPTWEAFVLAAAVGMATESSSLTVGPVPVSVRDPATIARGAVSVGAVAGRRVGVALGTASVRVVEKLHGQSRERPVGDLRHAATSIRRLIDTPSSERWAGDPDAEFLRRLGAPDGPLTIAAFGDKAIQVAAESGDRMLLDLVTPEQVRILRTKLTASTRERPIPTLAAWLQVAVDPSTEAIVDLKRGIAGYLTVAGYKEMLADAGMERAVAMASQGKDVDQVADAIPDHTMGGVGLIGDLDAVGRQVDSYAAAGLDEIAVVPIVTGDPRGERSLRALRSLA